MTDVIRWLLESDESWTRFLTLRDLLDQPESSAEVATVRQEMIHHPQVSGLIVKAAEWGLHPIKRHNDAGHSLYAMSTLADFGLRADDPGMQAIIAKIVAHQSPEGAFQSLANISRSFGGTGNDQWTWMLCDAPTLLYVLLSFDLGDDPRIHRAVNHLTGLAEDNGWRCS